ncbi:Dolichyl-phosphate-mannose-protein mannosyltransferase [Phycisphaerae bacterium RAS2]|nr:Dolichyl-phosphate-mannose-protein mannosyltransferase [Phycisphaerae bacterium RAS2]
MANSPSHRTCLIYAAIIALAAMLIARSSAAQLETLWDEQVDHDIAVALRDDPLRGESPALDASQTRLPMYLCAAAMKLTGRSDLQLCRDVSLVLGGLTIVLSASLAHLLFGGWTALLAATLLAASPYFLSFARIAMTEGDIAFSCAVVAALLAYLHDLRRPTPARWLIAGVLLGLAIGAKLFAIFLVPVLCVLATSSRSPRSVPESTGQPASHRKIDRWLMGSLAVGLAASLCAVLLAMASRDRAVVAWGFAAAAWLLGVVRVLFRGSSLPSSPMGRLVAMLMLAGLTFGALMPAHLTSHDILREIARRTLRWDNSIPLALWSDHLRLYAGIILVKLSIPFGLLTAVALLYAAFVERTDGRWRPCIIAIIFYIVLICFLPLRQTFYLMGVYPLIVVLTAAFAVETVRRLRQRSAPASALAATLIAACLVHLGVRGATAFPYFHLYGYDRVGDRWMGRESRGYRNLIQTPSDGVEELLQWCAKSERVRPADQIVSFLWEDRIVRNVLASLPRPVHLTPRGLTEESDKLPPQPDIHQAEWILLHINNRLGYGDRPPDWPPIALLEAQFTVAYRVRRGPIEVAWVYGRRERIEDKPLP